MRQLSPTPGLLPVLLALLVAAGNASKIQGGASSSAERDAVAEAGAARNHVVPGPHSALGGLPKPARGPAQELEGVQRTRRTNHSNAAGATQHKSPAKAGVGSTNIALGMATGLFLIFSVLGYRQRQRSRLTAYTVSLQSQTIGDVGEVAEKSPLMNSNFATNLHGADTIGLDYMPTHSFTHRELYGSNTMPIVVA